MESVAGNRAVLAYDHDEEAALDGAQLISAETDQDIQREQDIFIFINGNFAAFLRAGFANTASPPSTLPRVKAIAIANNPTITAAVNAL